jgi:hypothetical protein
MLGMKRMKTGEEGRSTWAVRRRHVAAAWWFWLALVLATAGSWSVLPVAIEAGTQSPGGFIEPSGSKATRPRFTPEQIRDFLPQPPGRRGTFMFPAPYRTEGIRITNADDCGGADCVWYVGYSYWRNMNNHVGSNTMYIFLGLREHGGPTLFSYDKSTEQVANIGPLFDRSSPFSRHTGEGWYFSATLPTKLYVTAYKGPTLFRYDVVTKQMERVLDVRPHYGPHATMVQVLSSNDDNVHSFTLNDKGKTVGCGVYQEGNRKFHVFPHIGPVPMDECHIDKSGRWLMILEDVDGDNKVDQRVLDLTGVVPERVILDQQGGVGHADEGYGYTVGANNFAPPNPKPNTITLYQYNANAITQTTVSHSAEWSAGAANHIAHSNAKAGVPLNQQYACGSNAQVSNGPRANEIVCFRLDTSQDVLVVADVMTDMNASGGGQPYGKLPKGNLDVTGRYFMWTSNLGTNRLDAFIVKLPVQLLLDTVGSETAPRR